MILETLNKKNLPALTSDHWHVVHARSTDVAPGRDGAGTLRFKRTIVSEHENRAEAAAAARALSLSIAPSRAGKPLAGQDQLFVRKPNYKSLKIAGRVKRRRK